MKLNYTAEAKSFVLQLKESSSFDIDRMEDIILESQVSAGVKNVNQYLDEKKRWNTVAVCEKVRNIVSSDQLKIVMKYIKFDEDDFKRWFTNSLLVNLSDVISYLEYLEKQKPKIEVIKQNG